MEDPDRPPRRWADATPQERSQHVVDDEGNVVYAGKIKEVRPDGVLVVEYDDPGARAWSGRRTCDLGCGCPGSRSACRCI